MCLTPLNRFLLIAAVIGLCASRSAVAQETAGVIPPEIRVFEKYDESLATITVAQTLTVVKPVTLTRVNAAGVEEQEIVLVPEVRVRESKHLLAEAAIRTVGGKELDRKEAAKQLKKGQPILLVAKASKFPEAFKSLFRDEAIIIEVNALGERPDLDGVKPARP